jgi:hypothetical protein
MSLASLDDVKTHLPPDKFAATDGNAEINLFQIDVDRLIKGYLSSVFSTATLAAWDEPANTPDYIRACAGRLVAAFYYAKKVSEDLPDWDRTYPQRLYDEALRMLDAVRTGEVDLGLAEEAGTEFGSDFFYPDSTAREPAFTMDMRF